MKRREYQRQRSEKELTRKIQGNERKRQDKIGAGAKIKAQLRTQQIRDKVREKERGKETNYKSLW